ncbi:OprO/OprP family phosphate-selective porin [Echinicola marina]|uniref:porin n=1 Tax=Echinicola marina TaxID=2859768 RepID=UPI001CF61F62|nr:porin [Echinicola marina]UCS91749.1 OprO/OprP family phosphate-selective porin [Echinicola marina]
MRIFLLIALMLGLNISLRAQEVGKSAKWFDEIHIGGYLQVRYNGLFETNPNLACEQCDENWGRDGGGLSLRRVRFKVKGQISPRVYFYFQPDFAKSVGGSHHVGRLKDAYIDVGLDRKNEFRIRIGQSKVPFGYENMQSSSNRLPLDRNDALNSAVKDERDLGVFFYWATEEKRALIKSLRKAGLSGGDFGLFALGFYNGQTANHPDKNDEFHVVTRFSYPVALGNQVIEPGLQAYSGKYVVTEHSPNIEVKTEGYSDQRAAMSFVLYPRPFGIQAEYNIGRGPEYDRASNTIQVKPLEGGYATFSYYLEKWQQQFYPFLRLQYYDGGKKHELDARSYTVRDTEVGVEWHPLPHFELLVEYAFSNRRYEDFEKPINHQKGGLMRIQAQVKF